MSRIGSKRGKELSDLLDQAEVLLEGAEHAARLHWPIFLIEGIALILFGVLAVFIPPLITIGLASSLGWVFVFGGIAALFVYFRLYRTQAFRQSLFLAVLSVIAGVALLVKPLSGIISLTVVLIVGFAIIGAAKFAYPLEQLRYLSKYRTWVRASGVADLVLAAWMFADLPATALWALGLLLGANMILGGIALVLLALFERRKLAKSQADQQSIPVRPGR
ncbi:MAG: DUF308 domain-containing protein [Bradyrhizobium sp.]|nr:DUF308 domain-containing protein [Bradyrhizobium sp.]